MSAELFEYRGIVWRRYPESRNTAIRNYFWGRPVPGQQKTTLHRFMYEQEVGPIPDGWHVHHVNENPLDNRPDNLSAISRPEHCREHQLGRPLQTFTCAKCGVEFQSRSARGAVYCGVKCRNAIRGKAPAIHQHECERCGAAFSNSRPHSRFCGHSCASSDTWARLSPDRTRTCSVCGIEFTRPGDQATCSRSCGNKLGYSRRKERRVQPDGGG